MLLRLLEGMSLFHFAKSEAYRPLNFPAHRAPLPCTALRTRCPSGKPAKATPGGKSKAVKPKAVPSGAPSKRARTKQPQDWHFSPGERCNQKCFLLPIWFKNETFFLTKIKGGRRFETKFKCGMALLHLILELFVNSFGMWSHVPDDFKASWWKLWGRKSWWVQQLLDSLDTIIALLHF